MNKKCPNCGREVDANAKFCTYCGYQFNGAGQPESNETRQHIYDNASNNDDSDDQSKYSGVSNDPNQKPPHKKSNKLVITLIIIIALLVIGGGVATYYLVLTPGSQNSQSSSSSSSSSHKASSSSSTESASSSDSSTSTSASSQSTISANDAGTLLQNIFSELGQSVGNGDDVSDISDNFVGGTSNSSYKDLANWVNLQQNNDKVEGVDINVLNVTTSGNKADFRVKYVFHQSDNNPDHVQIFDWHAQMEQSDSGDLLINSCTSNNTPVSQYDE